MKRILRLTSLLKIKNAFYLLLSMVIFIVSAMAVVAIYTHQNPMAAKLERVRNNTAQHIVNDVTEINPIKVLDITTPHSIEEIAGLVKKYDHIAIGGGRNSMGGETASERAIQLDLREYNKVLHFSKDAKEITVQSGIRWRDIQEYIDPSNLSVKIMQTYANFTVGGSLSVNVHGRYIGLGPIILSVKNIRLVLADGSIVGASPEKNSDLFYSAIGGMGGIGVIAEVTLSLADNVNVERSRSLLPAKEYWNFFASQVRHNSKVIFHNGDMYPPDFAEVSAVSWSVTDKSATTSDRLIVSDKSYWLERLVWVVMSEWPGGRWLRQHIVDPLIYRGISPVHTRNYEASYDYAELEPASRADSTYVLQEYFVPVENFDAWIPKMKKVFSDNDVNVLNVSIRHAFPDLGAKLAWARKESFAFVVYYKQGTDEAAKQAVGKWTRQMIDEVLSVDGTYYLPYQLHATDEQFHRAYPGAVDFFVIKKQYDPLGKFTNKLWDKYYHPEKLGYYQARRKELEPASAIKDYVRPFDNAYLSLPEWYIVYSADEYAAVLKDGLPSEFDYAQAIKDYWRQYDKVLELTENSTNNNDDYKTVLKVIGWSFTTENFIKRLYENSVGKLSEWIAGNTQVAEDKYAAQVAKNYAIFIYDYPWYDFPYFNYLKGLWALDSTVDYTFMQDIRRGERKIILSLELAIKTLYSKAVAYGTHQKFGVQDDTVYAIVTKDGGITSELIHAPHYHPFTRLLINEMEKQQSNPEFSINDISGNQKITFSYHDKTGAHVVDGAKEILRDNEISNISNGRKQLVDLITVEASVKDVFSIYKRLKAKKIVITHFYDY